MNFITAINASIINATQHVFTAVLWQFWAFAEKNRGQNNGRMISGIYVETFSTHLLSLHSGRFLGILQTNSSFGAWIGWGSLRQ